MYSSPLPVEVLRIVRTEPPRTTSRICRSRSISTPSPLSVALGRMPASSARSVFGPTTPSRFRPADFWNAQTACWVSDPYAPSGVPSQ